MDTCIWDGLELELWTPASGMVWSLSYERQGGGQFEMFSLTPLGRGSETLGVPRGAPGEGGWVIQELRNGN